MKDNKEKTEIIKENSKVLEKTSQKSNALVNYLTEYATIKALDEKYEDVDKAWIKQLATDDLFKAIKNNNLDKVKDAINRGAEINKVDKNGNTPLHTAIVGKYNPLIIRSLVQHRANLNAQNKDGNTPLHLLLDLNIKSVVSSFTRYFVHNGSNLTIRNNAGITPLHILLNKEYFYLINYFANNGVNMKDTSVKLEFEEIKGRKSIVSFSIKKKPEIQDSKKHKNINSSNLTEEKLNKKPKTNKEHILSKL